MESALHWHINQWDAYHMEGNLTFAQAMEELTAYMEKKSLPALNATTQIMIIPGYKIQSINGLITNFHQPRSTLLLLIATITGTDWKKIYDYALRHNFRFLSYGDSSLIYL